MPTERAGTGCSAGGALRRFGCPEANCLSGLAIDITILEMLASQVTKDNVTELVAWSDQKLSCAEGSEVLNLSPEAS